MKLFYTIIAVLLFFSEGHTQDLSEYSYIKIPEQFKFLNEPNEYGLTSGTKQQLIKYNIAAFIEGEKELSSLRNDLCSILDLEIVNNSSLFKTKVTMLLKNCEGITVFSSEEGTSKEKQYQRAFAEAFKEALQSFKTLALNNGEQAIEVNASTALYDSDGKKAVSNQVYSDDNSLNNDKLEATPYIRPVTNTYTSTDGFYTANLAESLLKFYEGDVLIGESELTDAPKFSVN